LARILFADDDREQLQVFQLLLESQGHEVLLAACAAEVLALLDGPPPGLLIVDLRFPSCADGLALLRGIRAAGCAMPIILLSGWPDEIQGAPELQLVSRVMVKPPRVPELLQAIDSLTR
jgi:DNA-binding response OmpR family regulator